MADPRSVCSSSSPSCDVVRASYIGGSDRLDMREGIGDNVVLSRNVPDVCYELGDKI
jgi:hypothetical protein